LLGALALQAGGAWRVAEADAGRDRQPRQFKLRNKEIRELEQTAHIDRLLARRGLVHGDPVLEDYVQSLGRRLVPESFSDPGIQLRFSILHSPEASAFALPNGSVYVSVGLLALVENEAQLAFVLAHEVSHVTRYHHFRYRRAYKGGTLARELLHVTAGWDSVWPALLAQVVGETLYAGTLLGYSRDLEEEADGSGLSLGVESGYEAAQMPALFGRLLIDYDGTHVESPLFYSSHPKLRTRIEYTEEMIARRGLAGGPGETHASRYAEVRRRACPAWADLAVKLDLPRTAIAAAEALLTLEPESAGPHYLRAEGFRALAHRPYEIGPPPTSEERRQRRREEWKKTSQEIQAEQAATAEGRAAWAANRAQALSAYEEALRIDPRLAAAYRGRALIYAADERYADAVAEAQRYLELAPASAFERPQMERLVARWEAGEGKP
jgi:predicted Zn-dependent protease